MTKAELQSAYDTLKEEHNNLIDEFNGLEEAYTDLERQNAELANNVADYYISDVENFKWRLQVDGLYTLELAEFIDNYMKYHNDLILG